MENFVNNQSNEIYTKRKINSFDTIFYILDKDQGNIISKSNININGLSKNIQKILISIFEEIKEKNLNLNKDSFYSYCNKLFENLNYAQKQEFISYINYIIHFLKKAFYLWNKIIFLYFIE